MLPAGGVSGGGLVGRKWREIGGRGRLGAPGPRGAGSLRWDARLPAFPARAAPGEPAAGPRWASGRERAGARGVSRGRHPARLPLARASRETSEDGLRKSDTPGSGFASGASGHLEPPSPTPRPVSASSGRHARPQDWARRLREEGPALGCAPPPQPPGSGQLLWAGAGPPPPRRARATLGAGERRPQGTTLGTGQTSGAQLVSGAKPCREQRWGSGPGLSLQGPPWFRRATASLGNKERRGPLGLGANRPQGRAPGSLGIQQARGGI